MGLDTTHDCWHGAYSSFAVWRAELAKAAARPTEMDLATHREYHVVDGDYPPRVYQGWWDETPDDILDVLLVHSDCDGWIFPDHAEALAERLEGLAPKMGDWQERTEEFAAGLRRAADEYEIVRFH